MQSELVAAAQLRQLARCGVDVRCVRCEVGSHGTRLGGSGWQAVGVYADLDRPPLRAAALTRALAGDGWRVEVLERASSTNAVVAHRAAAGEHSGLVVVAERQLSGRGRLDRTWVSPARAGLTFSVLLRPELPVGEWGWLPLLAGVAVAQGLQVQARVDAVLKWPNDVL